MVREHVGVCDVSSLGKIEVQGSDAAGFLDFIYSNIMSSLKVGGVRYGLMLREDGFIMDDGTCARLGRNHFVITTTTGSAGQVMQNLEFVRQCLRPDQDLRLASVTEQWAQFAIAGPKALSLVNILAEGTVNNENYPFMSCGNLQIGPAMARLFRISFSGEHAYEIAVPARFGASMFDLLVKYAEQMNGGAYGLEALNVLRIEKGFVTHAEINGRATAFDLGLGRMVSDKKACIGQAASKRPGMNGPMREQLVGLKPVGAQKMLTAGAHLFGLDAAAVSANDQGVISSVCFSPTLGHPIALAGLQNGRARHGELIRMVDHLRGIETRCEVCDPVFFDKKGGRVRG